MNFVPHQTTLTGIQIWFLRICPLLVAFTFIFGAYLGYEFADDELETIEKQVEVIKEVEKIIVKEVEVEKVIYRDRIKPYETRITEIIEKPVYKNICMDEEGLEAFNTFMGVAK